MIKRVNSTGRKRIPRENVAIAIPPDPPRRFEGRIDLAGFGFPDAAVVVVEATSAGSPLVARYAFGTVGRLAPPADCGLAGIEGANVLFQVKVIDQSQEVGRLLGLAEGIRVPAHGQAALRDDGLLAVEPADLGQEVWRLDFEEHDTVSLLVNRTIPGLQGGLRADGLFAALVMPQVVRAVLAEAHARGDLDEPDGWAGRWLRFGRDRHPDRTPPPAPTDADALPHWVAEVVDAFCAAHAFRDRYQAATRGES